MTIQGLAVDRITALSQGLPHFTHLLTQLAAQAALGERHVDVGAAEVDFAVERAIQRAQQSVDRGVPAGRDGRGGRCSPCALAEDDEFGFFGRRASPPRAGRRDGRWSGSSHSTARSESGCRRASRPPAAATASSTRCCRRTSSCAGSRTGLVKADPATTRASRAGTPARPARGGGHRSRAAAGAC